MKFPFVIALFLAVVSAQISWINCATGPTDMTILSFSMSPFPLCIGQNVCASATGVLNTPIIMPAKVAIIAKYLGHIVYTDNQDLCAILASIGIACPVPVTVTSISLCFLIKPSFPANIPVQMTISATNGNGNTLFCQGVGGGLMYELSSACKLHIASGVVAQNCSA